MLHNLENLPHATAQRTQRKIQVKFLNYLLTRSREDAEKFKGFRFYFAPFASSRETASG